MGHFISYTPSSVKGKALYEQPWLCAFFDSSPTGVDRGGGGGGGGAWGAPSELSKRKT